MKMSLFIIIIFVFCIAAFSTIYFASRTEYMFGVYGVKVNEENSTGHSSFAGTISGSYDFTELYSDSYHFDDL